jgi:hypothetical protein
MPSHRRGYASSTPSPTARTSGPCNAGPADAKTCPRPSRQSDHWYPTVPPPGNPPTHDDHADPPGKDVPTLIAHHVVKPVNRQWTRTCARSLGRPASLQGGAMGCALTRTSTSRPSPGWHAMSPFPQVRGGTGRPGRAGRYRGSRGYAAPGGCDATPPSLRVRRVVHTSSDQLHPKVSVHRRAGLSGAPAVALDHQVFRLRRRADPGHVPWGRTAPM